MKTGLVIPWRSGASRLKAFNFVLEWYRNVADDVYLADSGHKPFNVAASRNVGAQRATDAGCDMLIINDADTVVELGPLKSAIVSALMSKRVALPYTEYRSLTARGTKHALELGRPLEDCGHDVYDTAISGCLVMRPKVYWATAGQPEEFSGWGWEDNAYHHLHQVVLGADFMRHKGSAYAFWHDQAPRDRYNYNYKLYERLLRVTEKDQMIEEIKNRSGFKKL